MFKKTKPSPICKYCNSNKTSCNGNKLNKQRYICKDCGKSFCDNDSRIKKSNKEREMCLLLYTHNMSMRSIQSTIEKFFDTKIHFRTIEIWIRSFSKMLNFDIEKTKEKTQKPKTIEIIEMDELYSKYYDNKKNSKKESKYGKQTLNVGKLDACIKV